MINEKITDWLRYNCFVINLFIRSYHWGCYFWSFMMVNQFWQKRLSLLENILDNANIMLNSLHSIINFLGLIDSIGNCICYHLCIMGNCLDCIVYFLNILCNCLNSIINLSWIWCNCLNSVIDFLSIINNIFNCRSSTIALLGWFRILH